MTKRVEAIYEKGVLRPLEPLPLVENQHVSVTVCEVTGDTVSSMIDQIFVNQACREVNAAAKIPTHEEIRRLTAKDVDSWAVAIVTGREERL